MNALKHAACLATTLVALAACAPKAPDTAADTASLKAEAASWFDRYTAGDADGVAALYAEDGVVLAPGTPKVVGRAAIRDFIASDIKAAGLAIKPDELTDVGISGDLGWATGTFSVVDASGATVDKGKYVTLYRRGADGKWPILRDTWNSDMPPPAAAPAAAPAPKS